MEPGTWSWCMRVGIWIWESTWLWDLWVRDLRPWNLTLATGLLDLGPGTGTQVLGAGTATLFGTWDLGAATMVLGFGS